MVVAKKYNEISNPNGGKRTQSRRHPLAGSEPIRRMLLPCALPEIR